MSIIGQVQGNLSVDSLSSKDKEKYGYTVWYYNCHCNLCGRDVILPSTNVRKYRDCGNHWKEKLMKHYPFGDRSVTMREISEMTGLQYTYVCALLRKGLSVEQIINRTSQRKRKTL